MAKKQKRFYIQDKATEKSSCRSLKIGGPSCPTLFLTSLLPAKQINVFTKLLTICSELWLLWKPTSHIPFGPGVQNYFLVFKNATPLSHFMPLLILSHAVWDVRPPFLCLKNYSLFRTPRMTSPLSHFSGTFFTCSLLSSPSILILALL